MLQVIREYAFDMLEATGEAGSIRDRHAAAFQALAEAAAPNLFGGDQKRWLDRLELDQDNFRAAFDWSVSHGNAQRALMLGAAFWRFWQMRGHLREGRPRMDAILALPGARENARNRSRALEAAGGIAYWQGDIDAEEIYYGEALELARQDGDPLAIANALYNYSFPFQTTGRDVPKAIAALDEALPIFRRLGDDSGVAKIVWGLAQCHRRTRNWPDALTSVNEAITLFRRLGDRFGLGWAVFVRATIKLQTGDLENAKTDDLEALRFFADVNDVSGYVLAFGALAGIEGRLGDRIRAARLQGASDAQETSSGAGLGSLISTAEGWRPNDLTEAEAAAYAEGKTMTVQQAVDYALSETDAASTIASS